MIFLGHYLCVIIVVFLLIEDYLLVDSSLLIDILVSFSITTMN